MLTWRKIWINKKKINNFHSSDNVTYLIIFFRRALIFFGLLCLACFIFILGFISKLDAGHPCEQILHIQREFFGAGKAIDQPGNLNQINIDLRLKTESCFNIVRPKAKLANNSTWSEFKIQQGLQKQTIFIYSAHFDDRATGRDLPHVRILATSSGDLAHYQLSCQFWYPSLQMPYVATASIDLLQDNGNVKEYMFSCEVFSTDPKPTHLSLTAGDKCCNATNVVKINMSIRQKPSQVLGLCVLDAHHLDIAEHPYWLIEWLEMYRLLGVRHVTFYNTSTLPAKVHGVIEGYVLSGVAELCPMTSPEPAGFRQGLSLSNNDNGLTHIILNDCLLKNLYRYRYTLVSGYNSIIIPQSGQSYQQAFQLFLHYTKGKAAIPSLSFDRLYFTIEKSNKDDLSSGLWIENKKKISPMNGGDVIAPLMVDLDSCVFVKDGECLAEEWGEQARGGGRRLIPHKGLHAGRRVASAHSFFMQCQQGNSHKCLQKEVRDIGGEDGSQQDPSDSFKQMMSNLRIRVKSMHDIIRLDYDW